jgi:hypothetical protein
MRGIVPKIITRVRIGVMCAMPEIVRPARVETFLFHGCAIGGRIGVPVDRALGQETVAKPIHELHRITPRRKPEPQRGNLLLRFKAAPAPTITWLTGDCPKQVGC